MVGVNGPLVGIPNHVDSGRPAAAVVHPRGTRRASGSSWVYPCHQPLLNIITLDNHDDDSCFASPFP